MPGVIDNYAHAGGFHRRLSHVGAWLDPLTPRAARSHLIIGGWICLVVTHGLGDPRVVADGRARR